MNITGFTERFVSEKAISKTSKSNINTGVSFKQGLSRDVFEKNKVSFGKNYTYEKPIICKDLTDDLFAVFKRSPKPANTVRLTTSHGEALANLGLDYEGNITIKLSYQTISEGKLKTFCVTLLPDHAERKVEGKTSTYCVSSKLGVQHRINIDHIHDPEKTIDQKGSILKTEQILKILTNDSTSDNIEYLDLQHDFMQLHLEREEAYRNNLEQLKRAEENKPETIVFDETVLPFKNDSGALTSDKPSIQLPDSILDLDNIVKFYNRLHHRNVKPDESVETHQRVTFITAGNSSSLVQVVVQKPSPEEETDPAEVLYKDNSPGNLTNLAAQERRSNFKVITGDKTEKSEGSVHPELVSVTEDNIDQIIEEKGSNPEARITDRDRTLAGLHYKQANTSARIEDSETLYQGKEYREKKAREEYEKQQAEEYARDKKRFRAEIEVLVHESTTEGNVTTLPDLKSIKDKRVLNPDLPNDADYKAPVVIFNTGNEADEKSSVPAAEPPETETRTLLSRLKSLLSFWK